MVKRESIHLEASPEYAAIARQSLAIEIENREETQAQCDEVFAQMRAEQEAIDQLHTERERQGLSLEEIETRCGVASSSISKLENHQTKDLTLATLRSYASALGMRIQLSVSPADSQTD